VSKCKFATTEAWRPLTIALIQYYLQRGLTLKAFSRIVEKEGEEGKSRDGILPLKTYSSPLGAGKKKSLG